MVLEGWNHIPDGYGASFAVEDAPWWLRLWYRLPFLDRFAYPLLVRRGHGYLRAFPGVPDARRGPVGEGWKVREDSDVPPGSPAAT